MYILRKNIMVEPIICGVSLTLWLFGVIGGCAALTTIIEIGSRIHAAYLDAAEREYRSYAHLDLSPPGEHNKNHHCGGLYSSLYDCLTFTPWVEKSKYASYHGVDNKRIITCLLVVRLDYILDPLYILFYPNETIRIMCRTNSTLLTYENMLTDPNFSLDNLDFVETSRDVDKMG